MERLKIKYPIIVEGKYDKIKISSIAEACVIQTDGFGIFKKSELLTVIKRLSERTPVIVLTDSDGAGKVIRSHISSAIPKDRLIQLYIPQIEGKEKRKTHASAEGYLGVEGVEAEILRKLLVPFSSDKLEFVGIEIDTARLYEDGLTGREDSAQRRDEIASVLGLPKGMRAAAFARALSVACTEEEYQAALVRFDEKL